MNDIEPYLEFWVTIGTIVGIAIGVVLGFIVGYVFQTLHTTHKQLKLLESLIANDKSKEGKEI